MNYQTITFTKCRCTVVLHSRGGIVDAQPRYRKAYRSVRCENVSLNLSGTQPTILLPEPVHVYVWRHLYSVLVVTSTYPGCLVRSLAALWSRVTCRYFLYSWGNISPTLRPQSHALTVWLKEDEKGKGRMYPQGSDPNDSKPAQIFLGVFQVSTLVLGTHLLSHFLRQPFPPKSVLHESTAANIYSHADSFLSCCRQVDAWRPMSCCVRVFPRLKFGCSMHPVTMSITCA